MSEFDEGRRALTVAELARQIELTLRFVDGPHARVIDVVDYGDRRLYVLALVDVPTRAEFGPGADLDSFIDTLRPLDVAVTTLLFDRVRYCTLIAADIAAMSSVIELGGVAALIDLVNSEEWSRRFPNFGDLSVGLTTGRVGP